MMNALCILRFVVQFKKENAMNQIDLKNRHAIVTGAGQGIGLSIAKRLLASGASVSLWDRDKDLLATVESQLGSGYVE